MIQLAPFDFLKGILRTFALSNENKTMTAQYQKTSIQIIDLMQQNAIKTHLFCVLKT
jgi:hypothetical protein